MNDNFWKRKQSLISSISIPMLLFFFFSQGLVCLRWICKYVQLLFLTSVVDAATARFEEYEDFVVVVSLSAWAWRVRGWFCPWRSHSDLGRRWWWRVRVGMALRLPRPRIRFGTRGEPPRFLWWRWGGLEATCSCLGCCFASWRTIGSGLEALVGHFDLARPYSAIWWYFLVILCHYFQMHIYTVLYCIYRYLIIMRKIVNRSIYLEKKI